jgi:hypothetical protein
MIAAYVISCLTWAFFGGLMFAQYHDEAAGYMPRFVMSWWGVVVVVTMLGQSLEFLGRAIVGQFPHDAN